MQLISPESQGFDHKELITEAIMKKLCSSDNLKDHVNANFYLFYFILFPTFHNVNFFFFKKRKKNISIYIYIYIINSSRSIQKRTYLV